MGVAVLRGQIILHVGLPKAASTYLQNIVFPGIPDVVYVHKSHNKSSLGVVRSLRRHCRDGSSTVRSVLDEIPESIQGALSSGRKVLVSDENLCMSSMAVWEKTGCRPIEFAERAHELAEALGVDVRIAYVGRKLESWLPSRYAQSAPRFENPGQSDFEERVLEIVQLYKDMPALEWLREEAVLEAFNGRGNRLQVATTTVEQMRNDPMGAINQLLAEMGVKRFVVDPEQDNAVERINQRQRNQGWVLRGGTHKIKMTEELERHISGVQAGGE